jgi:hypothetical protein
VKPSAPADQTALLRRRCRRILADHKRRAARDAKILDYGLADLVKLVRESPQCYYCRMPVGWDFQVDHKVPSPRTVQAHSRNNLVVACSGYNGAKGMMDAEEFHRLLQLLSSFHPQAAQDVLRRLRAGGRRYAGG